MKHEPVLLQEVLLYLDPQPGDFMIDGTLDGGGHATAILEKVLPGGTLLGVDWDETMLASHKDSGMKLVHANYADLAEVLERENMPKADGLLLDLGFSSEQLAQSGRGFSFSEATAHEPLLMTYDDSRPPVSEILRELSEESLANIIYELGGERRSRQIAKAIKDKGRRKAISTSGELAEIIRSVLPGNYEHGRIDRATRTFQALRIYANGELENLKKILEDLPKVVRSGGRVVIITFHSLEDRIVKLAFQHMKKEGTAELLTKKPVAGTRDEILKNPRARSAKIRAIRMQ